MAAPAPQTPASQATATDWQVVSRSRDGQVWQRTITETIPGTQRQRTRTRQIVELATGLNYLDAQGQWQRTQEHFQAMPDGGFVAAQGPPQVILAANLNQADAVDVLTSDGARLRSQPVAIGYYDPVDGRNLVLAVVKDAAPKLTAPNEVTYADAFDGLRASVRYTYRRSGLSQDVILHEAPPGPRALGLSARSRLEVYTAFDPNGAAPQVQAHVLAREADPVVRAAMVEPDLVDHTLRFGAYRMGPGKAFKRDANRAVAQARSPVRVGKAWQRIDGTPVLIESTPCEEVSRLFAGMPQAEVKHLAWQAPRQAEGTGDARVLPLASLRASVPKPTALLAKATPPASTIAANFEKHGVVLDYTLNLSSGMDVTLEAGMTYRVSGSVYLDGTTVLEGGAVLKFEPGAVLQQSSGTVVCQTGPYRPVIFTSKDDDTVGEVIPGSSGQPQFVPGSHYLELSMLGSTTLSYLHFRYADAAVMYDLSTGDNVLSHAQFLHNNWAVFADSSTFHLRNVLMVDVTNAIFGWSFTGTAEHLTVHQCPALTEDQGTASTLGVTNSILAAVSSLGNAAVTTGSVATPLDGSAFQTVGAAAYYLADDTYRDQGLGAINWQLAQELKQKTTYPPSVQLAGGIAVDMTLNPVVPRDSNTPDLGYHYDPLDYVFSGVILTNATLTLNPGTVLGVAVHYAGGLSLLMEEGARLVGDGLPTNPARLVRYNTVQEQANTQWAFPGPAIVYAWWNAQPAPATQLRFTHLSLMQAEGFVDYLFPGKIDWQDSEIYGGRWYVSVDTTAYQGVTRFHNCLWDGAVLSTMTPTLVIQNNLFHGGLLDLWDADSSSSIYDTLFDRTAIEPWIDIANAHNGYVTGYPTLTPFNGATEVVLAGSPAYPAGPLGRFYLPQSAPEVGYELIDAGSQSAASAGLYHYTTATDQAKEGSSTVDIGYHYVALDGNGQPVDTDGDYVPDYLEDTNGNGQVDVGEADWTTPDTDNDGDGLSNEQEALLFGYSPVRSDSDGDGVGDYDEDFDGDLLTDGAELNHYGSDPKVANSMHPSVADFDWFYAAILGNNNTPAQLCCLSFTGGNVQMTLNGGDGIYDLFFAPVFANPTPWMLYALGPATRLDPPNEPITFAQVAPGTPSGFFKAGLNRHPDGSLWDDDGDEVGVAIEGTLLGTSPDTPDTDGDGVPDGQDAFPRDGAASVDTDGDGQPDEFHPGKGSTTLTVDTDDDNDGIPDSVEDAIVPGSNPPRPLSDSKDAHSLPPPTFFVDARFVPPPGTRDGSQALPFAAIQDALDNLPPADPDRYDVIQVERGVYCGPGNYNIDFGGRNVVLIALRGPEETVINCGVVAACDSLATTTCDPAPAGTVAFNFHSGEGDSSRVIGFTIRNAPASAIRCVGASPVIINCVVENNGTQGGDGGGFYLLNSSAIILNCTILNNGHNGALGGGLYADDTNPGNGRSNPRVSHCTFSGNIRQPNQGQIHVRGDTDLLLHNSTVWSGLSDSEIVKIAPATATVSYCNVRGGFDGLLNCNTEPALEASGRLTLDSGSVDRGTASSIPGYLWATRFDRDGEARLQIQPSNILFSADIGSDEYVYRIPFLVYVDPDGQGKPKRMQNGDIFECDIPAGQVDEASGVVYLGDDGSGRALIAVIDDEQEEWMYIYRLNVEGTGVDSGGIFPISTLNLTYSGSARQVLDLEGVTYDANNRDLYLTCSNTKRRRYRDVENKLLDPMVYSPTNDYDRRRHVLLKIRLNPDLTTVASRTFYEPEDVVYPNNVYFNPTRGLIRTIRDSLANTDPYRPQTLGTHILIAWNTVDKFGTPVNGTDYSAGNTLPGGGTVLGVYPASTTMATHGSRPANTWHYYKMWIRNGATVAQYAYTEFMTASAQTRPYHSLFINEFLARSDPPENDWIELFNPMNVAAPLANYRIKDAPPGDPFYLNGPNNTFSVSPPTVPGNGFLRLNAVSGTQSGTTLNFSLAGGGEQIVLRPPAGFDSVTIDHWVYPNNQKNNRSQGRVWDGGPSGMQSRPLPYQREREAMQFQAIGEALFPTTPVSQPPGPNHGDQRNSFLAAAGPNNDTIYLLWRWRTQSPAVWDYSPKLHDFHALNIEAIAYCAARPGITQPEMIIGLRSPLSINRTNGNALYYRVTDVNQFLPDGGGWAGAAAGVTGPHLINLNGQGFRSIEWCPGIGPGGAGRYLIIGGPANGGPLEKETFGEKFSLYSWNGDAATTPTRLIEELRPYTVRPEGVALIAIGGQPRVMFVEDRFLAQGYGARNVIHWPVSILTSEVTTIP